MMSLALVPFQRLSFQKYEWFAMNELSWGWFLLHQRGQEFDLSLLPRIKTESSSLLMDVWWSHRISLRGPLLSPADCFLINKLEQATFKGSVLVFAQWFQCKLSEKLKLTVAIKELVIMQVKEDFRYRSASTSTMTYDGSDKADSKWSINVVVLLPRVYNHHRLWTMIHLVLQNSLHWLLTSVPFFLFTCLCCLLIFTVAMLLISSFGTIRMLLLEAKSASDTSSKDLFTVKLCLKKFSPSLWESCEELWII